MTRAVFDANVLIAAALRPGGTSAACLTAFHGGRLELIVSHRLLEELDRLIEYEKFRRYLSVDEAQRFIEALASSALHVADPPDAEPLSCDPEDDYLIALARAADAHVLVSGDAHLLALRLPDLLIVGPAEFLRRLPE